MSTWEPEQPPAQAGWYSVSPDERRYWDGQAWNDQAAPASTAPTASQTARKVAGLGWLCLVASFPLSLLSLYWIGAIAVIASVLLGLIAAAIAIVGLTRREGSAAAWALVSSGALVMVFLFLLGAGVAMSA